MIRLYISLVVGTLVGLLLCYLMAGWPGLVGGLLGIPVAAAIISWRKHGTRTH